MRLRPVLSGCQSLVETGYVCNVQFAKYIFFSLLALTLLSRNPDLTCESLRDKHELGPIPAAFRVTFVGSSAAEGDGEGDDEAKDGQEDIVDTEGVDVVGNARTVCN